MTWQQLHIRCAKPQVELAEALLMENEALSIVLEDAGDQPLFEPLPGKSPIWDDVVVTGIFAFNTDVNYEALVNELALECQATNAWLSSVEDKNWEREWMKNYHPIECANNLWIVPNWLTPPNPDAINIIMDPGLAFGTGYHATTRLCLDWLTEQDLAGKTIVDYGCGSGILGIAALLLGAKHVYSVDIDPQAVLASKQNAERNGVSDVLQSFTVEDFTHFCEHESILPVDMITANILAKPLMGLAPHFATILKDGGEIVLSGLIENQINEVIDIYANNGFDVSNQHRFNDTDDSHWIRLSGKISAKR